MELGKGNIYLSYALVVPNHLRLGMDAFAVCVVVDLDLQESHSAGVSGKTEFVARLPPNGYRENEKSGSHITPAEPLSYMSLGPTSSTCFLNWVSRPHT